MNILLFGSSGFIGSYFKDHFLRLGHKVTGVDCIIDEFLHPSFCFIRGDLTSSSFFTDLMICRHFDILINCAARTDLNGDSLDDYDSNYKIPRLISEFYDNHPFPGIKLIHFSSMLRNSAPGEVTYFYGKSKNIGDKSFLLGNRSFVAYVIELPSVWGPFMKAPYLNFFNLVRWRLYFYTRFFSGPKSFLYVGNLFELVLSCFSSNLPTCRIVAKDYDISSNEFARMISSSMGFKLFSVPDVLIFLLAKIGDVLAFASISFPLNSFRLSNMTKGRVVQPTCVDPDSYTLTSMESAIALTLQHLIEYK